MRASRRKQLATLDQASRQDLSERLLEIATSAEAEGDVNEMRRISYKLLRLDHYERAWQLRVRSAELTQHSPIPEWGGDDLAGRSILIRAYAPKDRIGEELRLARFIAPAAQRACRCIVLSEAQLVPLLQRSFSGADVRRRGTDDAAAFAEADVAAYYETIALHHAKTAAEMRHSFVRLRADPTLIGVLRQRYTLKSHGPLVGIAWGSGNKGKILPHLRSWAPLLGLPSATFVSLQYGEIDKDLEILQDLSGGRVIHDTMIDQLVDLDGFAAQIAALDAVVSISNTTIDMSGMLGMPTLHIRDDTASAIWPKSGRSPWYPDMVFCYRKRRAWDEVFAEARRSLEQLMSLSR